MPRDSATHQGATGAVLLALAVFVGWGVFPGFFKLLVSVPPAEILAHRILWSAAFMLVLLIATGQLQPVRDTIADRRTLGLLTVSALLIAVNWLVYVGTVTSGHVLEASLGYFISPLANVALGRIVLRERLTLLQTLACGLAALAVAGFALSVGPSVWRSVVLALSFGCYGLVRKLVRADPQPGFAVECFLLAPVAGCYLLYRGLDGAAPLDHPPGILALLMLSGVLTSLPLLGYAVAARKLRLSTLGLLNYVTPSIQFVLGVAVYDEPFDLVRLGGFAVIWLALGLYSIEMLRMTRWLQPR